MYLDFKEISKVPFKAVLDHLGVIYEETKEGFKGKLNDTSFVVTESKNLFLCPHNKDWKGSVISFWAIFNETTLPEAAKAIKKEFLDEKKPPERSIPELKLEYCAWLRTNGVSPETADTLEAGLCSQRSIMAGKICFKMYSADGSECVGYIGYDKDGKPFVPNGYKHDHIFNLHRVRTDWAIVAKSPLEAAKLHSAGHNNVIGLTRETLTDAQITHLSLFKKLAFYDCAPVAVLRMAKHCDVRIADDEYLGKL